LANDDERKTDIARATVKMTKPMTTTTSAMRAMALVFETFLARPWGASTSQRVLPTKPSMIIRPKKSR